MAASGARKTPEQHARAIFTAEEDRTEGGLGGGERDDRRARIAEAVAGWREFPLGFADAMVGASATGKPTFAHIIQQRRKDLQAVFQPPIYRVMPPYDAACGFTTDNPPPLGIVVGHAFQTKEAIDQPLLPWGSVFAKRTFPPGTAPAVIVERLLAGVPTKEFQEAARNARDALAAFLESGGTYIQAPAVTVGDPTIGFPTNGWKMDLYANDTVLPMCHEGMNRSQVLAVVLGWAKYIYAGMFGLKEFRIKPPHGAESGFDPYQGYANLTPENFTAFLHGSMLPMGAQGEWPHAAFAAAFGVTKQPRAGEAELSKEVAASLNEPDNVRKMERARQIARATMNDTLYNAEWYGGTGRIVILGFARSPYIFVKRLVEATKASRRPLDSMRRFVIVALPYSDTISRAGGRDEATKLLAARLRFV